MHRHLSVAEVDPFAPSELAAAWSEAPYLALLENPGEASELGRYAYLCRDPFWLLRSKRGRCWSGPPGREELRPHGAFTELERLLARYRGGALSWRPGLPPFVGGALGYLGYELLYELETVPDTGRDDLELPDAYLLFYDLVYARDAHEGRSWVLATGFGATPAAAESAAQARLVAGCEALADLVHTSPARASELRAQAEAARARTPSLRTADLGVRGIRPTIERDGYLASIASIQADIHAGRVFEVCLTQRFDCGPPPPSGAELYAALRTVNPAPMSAYLRYPGIEVLSASPERFVSLDRAGVAETRPIKGTRPRGATPAEDQALAEDLRQAEKDRAENLMIVDLCRNDLGRVCRFGSVRVSELCAVHPYAFTWQMVSTIHGVLRESLGPVDLLRASFPGGSMTGAPKIEAMKVIDALEPTKRGVFSGAIGYLDFDGALDLSIVIRTLVCSPGRLTFHVGGAIVADSDPADEYQETLDKAHGLVLALDMIGHRGPADG